MGPSTTIRLSGVFLFILISATTAQCPVREGQAQIQQFQDGENSVLNHENPIIILLTLEGTLYAVNKYSGAIKWQQQEDRVVTMSKQVSHQINPSYLPNPKDGSLYALGTEPKSLVKLPFTIPELVAASPSQGSEGMLYMGKKMDTWYVLDATTGLKQEVLSFSQKSSDKSCPRKRKATANKEMIYMGRTDYSLVLFNSTTNEQKWNVTYIDYASSTMGAMNPGDYNLAHFTSTSTGQIVTLNRRSGDILWELDLHSPVVGVYGLGRNPVHPITGLGLINLPFTSLAAETLQDLAQTSLNERRDLDVTDLFQMLFVGQNAHGMYAIPSLANKWITSDFLRLMIEGPDQHEAEAKPVDSAPVASGQVNMNIPYAHPVSPLILFGYFKLAQLPPTDQSGMSFLDAVPVEMFQKADATSQTDDAPPNETYPLVHSAISVLLTLIGMAVVFWVNPIISENIQELSNEATPLRPTPRTAPADETSCQVTQVEASTPSESAESDPLANKKTASYSQVIELPSGFIQVGKIRFSPNHILGKGCEGTFVYKGQYDNRDVAVKRLLPECFIVADREVQLLRESDAHPNVIRYFCTEQDRQFKYIALELGVATLQDYVEDRYKGVPIDGTTILRHATAGLAHLHSLDIVHRDVKPHNVLISAPNLRGEVRAMISDFGLCKKLKIGRMSFSRRSGVTGTDGWIAPEMMTDAERRTTCAVDVFSLGLVYYYVLTKGQHPYGDALRRQANILSGDSDLQAISDDAAAHTLIERMLSVNPVERPPARAIHRHPIFWSREKILCFFIDTSDRVDKETTESAVLQCLERDASNVVRGSWKIHVEPTVMQDLRRHRTYQGQSIRDLLRALRNKKNHYREVTEDVRRIMGRTPEEFCDFWTARFPRLLMHTWYAMHCVKNEHVFSRYFDRQYDFIQKPIVWTTFKPKSFFRRNMAADYPGFNPPFLKAAAAAAATPVNAPDEADQVPAPQPSAVVPDSWDQNVAEPDPSDDSAHSSSHNSSQDSAPGCARNSVPDSVPDSTPEFNSETSAKTTHTSGGSVEVEPVSAVDHHSVPVASNGVETKPMDELDHSHSVSERQNKDEGSFDSSNLTSTTDVVAPAVLGVICTSRPSAEEQPPEKPVEEKPKKEVAEEEVEEEEEEEDEEEGEREREREKEKEKEGEEWVQEKEIVLGPGGQWGRLLGGGIMRPPSFLPPSAGAGASSTSREAAWKLPSLAQNWTFSEIENHGRRKKKIKKKNKTTDAN